MDVRIIIAVAENGVIGKDNKLPWKISSDLKRFRELTTGHCVIMGRKTFESIGRPLPNRTNIVISSQLNEIDGVVVASSLSEGLKNVPVGKIAFIIGGARLFAEALPISKIVHMTEVLADVEGDVSFPKTDWKNWRKTLVGEGKEDEKNSFPFRFIDYTNEG